MLQSSSGIYKKWKYFPFPYEKLWGNNSLISKILPCCHKDKLVPVHFHISRALKSRLINWLVIYPVPRGKWCIKTALIHSHSPVNSLPYPVGRGLGFQCALMSVHICILLRIWPDCNVLAAFEEINLLHKNSYIISEESSQMHVFVNQNPSGFLIFMSDWFDNTS
jgi:hypothetical protein